MALGGCEFFGRAKRAGTKQSQPLRPCGPRSRLQARDPPPEARMTARMTARRSGHASAVGLQPQLREDLPDHRRCELGRNEAMISSRPLQSGPCSSPMSNTHSINQAQLIRAGRPCVQPGAFAVCSDSPATSSGESGYRQRPQLGLTGEGRRQHPMEADQVHPGPSPGTASPLDLAVPGEGPGAQPRSTCKAAPAARLPQHRDHRPTGRRHAAGAKRRVESG